MMNELIVRFVLGGAIVSIVAGIAEMLEPKTFAGLFGAAPSVALATLILAYSKHGPSYVATEGRSMVIGAIALFSYSCACVAGSKNRHLPVWLVASAAWGVWFVVVIALWASGRARGVWS
jgi:uncharacterized membrane protein (GlpM family)